MPMTKHVENKIRKSELVKYTECNKKYESNFAKYMFTNEKKILRKCHDYNLKFETKKNMRVELKKEMLVEFRK